ncbi:MAG: NAD(P)-dependent oxidoreductase [Candidatus Azobacteroides pseudotrichonymphae]|nr:MAG: NAD(P)-dependent oxidoreductase [Candidatus Azobacteroides pseudotrichonymphae]
MKVLILTEKPFTTKAIDSIKQIISNASMEAVILEKYTDKYQVLNAVEDVDAIIIRSDLMTNEILDAAKKLKIVVRAGSGVDNVDLVAASVRNIVVMNTPGQNANAVAELAIGMMIYASRNFYDGSNGTELKGKKLGIHAYGNVGRNVAKIAKGFEMDIYAYDSFCPAEIIEKDGIKAFTSVEELYRTCQYISLHIPCTPETKYSINHNFFTKMLPRAILINTARKEVINEEDLINWMENSPEVRYITDIMPNNDKKLREKFSKRYFSTPKKMGAQTTEANNNAGIAAANQVINFLLNGNTQFQVN